MRIRVWYVIGGRVIVRNWRSRCERRRKLRIYGARIRTRIRVRVLKVGLIILVIGRA